MKGGEGRWLGAECAVARERLQCWCVEGGRQHTVMCTALAAVVPQAQHQPALRVSLCLCLLQACAMPWTCALHPVAGARWGFCGGGEG